MDQHCWGCRKRRVVCDLGRPGCAKCARIGIECPGYGKQKPLQWLAVGRVKCKEKRKKSPSAAPTAKQANRKMAVPTTSHATIDMSESQEQLRGTPESEGDIFIKDQEFASDAYIRNQEVASDTYSRDQEFTSGTCHRDPEFASSSFYGKFANMLVNDETTDVIQATWHCK